MAAQGTQPVSTAEGEAFARDIGAKYFECSSKTRSGVKEVFDGALRESLKGRFGGLAGALGGGGGSGGGGKKGKKRKGKDCVVL